MPDMTIALIGCGKMGGALLESWPGQNAGYNFIVFDPGADPRNPLFQKAELFKDTEGFENPLRSADILVLAVKPQIMDEACAGIAGFVKPDALVISIAAGKESRNIQKLFSKDQPVIRVMPNTPAAIGKGMSALYATETVTPRQKDIAAKLFNAAGKTEWLEDEALFGAITAVSGSGPAYFFYFAECLTQAGIEAGLTEASARALARETFIGSAALAEHEAAIPLEQLRKNVTSPGGTTEAALTRLMDGRLTDIVEDAITAAVQRSNELSE